MGKKNGCDKALHLFYLCFFFNEWWAKENKYVMYMRMGQRKYSTNIQMIAQNCIIQQSVHCKLSSFK